MDSLPHSKSYNNFRTTVRMKKLMTKPHYFFFALVPIILMIGYLKREDVININISFSNYTINILNACYLFSVFFALIGFNYFSLSWANKQPKRWLSFLHMLLQILSLVLFFTRSNWNWIGVDENTETLNYTLDYSNFILILSLFVFLIATFIHLINFFTTLFLKSE